MPQMNMVQAINAGLRHEMKKDDRVVVLGEDAQEVLTRLPKVLTVIS